MQSIKQLAEQLGCSVVESPKLSQYTTFRIGGIAPLCIDLPSNAATQIVQALREKDRSCFWIGKGSNLLVSDRGISDVLLHLIPTNEVFIQDNIVTCDAGLPVIELCKIVRDAGLSGLEFAFGIPGTVGGGVYMNAGAYGGEFSQVLQSAKVLCSDGTVKEILASDLQLGYRHSALMETGGIVLEATFKLQKDDASLIQERMQDFMNRRREKQPLNYASAGSFFKRPEGHFAGGLIQQCGLKGFRIGDAMISDKHAGFLVNCGNATCDEVKAVAREVRRRVLEETGVELQPEVRLIGETWEE